jgi:phosphoribosylanthranilate isomerase
VFVKICGVRTFEDALACAEAGADAIGFNFWPSSKRYVAIDDAAEIARRLPKTLEKWGVFVDPEPEEVDRSLAAVVDRVQFHGAEPPAFCARWKGRYVKALRLGDEGALLRMSAYDCEPLLVDADAPGYGGSGLRANVQLARKAAELRKIVLAGGLGPDNVAAAVAAVKPFGVDVATGVERSPGVKDWIKVAAFVRAAKEAA